MNGIYFSSEYQCSVQHHTLVLTLSLSKKFKTDLVQFDNIYLDLFFLYQICKSTCWKEPLSKEIATFSESFEDNSYSILFRFFLNSCFNVLIHVIGEFQPMM